MKNIKLFFIAALLGTVLAGCQKEVEIQNPEEQPVEKGWTLTVKVSKGVETKALDYDGANNKLSPYWEVGETVDVYLVGGGDTKIGTLEVKSVDGTTGVAELKGDISETGLTEGSSILKLVTPGNGQDWTYANQDGQTPDDAFDFATSCLRVKTLDTVIKEIETEGYDPVNDAIVTDPVFTSEQSVYRLTFKVGGSAIDPLSFTMSASQNKLVQTRTFNGSDWTSVYGPISAMPSQSTSDHFYFLSVRNENEGTTNKYSFTVVNAMDDILYEGTKDIDKQLVNGKLYNATINLTQKTIPQTTSSETVTTAL